MSSVDYARNVRKSVWIYCAHMKLNKKFLLANSEIPSFLRFYCERRRSKKLLSPSALNLMVEKTLEEKIFNKLLCFLSSLQGKIIFGKFRVVETMEGAKLIVRPIHS